MDQQGQLASTWAAAVPCRSFGVSPGSADTDSQKSPCLALSTEFTKHAIKPFMINRGLRADSSPQLGNGWQQCCDRAPSAGFSLLNGKQLHYLVALAWSQRLGLRGQDLPFPNLLAKPQKPKGGTLNTRNSPIPETQKNLQRQAALRLWRYSTAMVSGLLGLKGLKILC